MAGDCVPYYEDSDRITVTAGAAVSGRTFAGATSWAAPGPGFPGASPDNNIVCGVAPAASRPLGVWGWDAALGQKVTLLRVGIVPVIAGAAIAFGAEVEVGASGRAITLASGKPVGICLGTASANGDVVPVALNVA